MAVIGLAALSAVLSVLAAHGTCSEAGVETGPGGAATREVPAGYLSLYRQAGGVSGVPWSVLAAIGSIETDHGRSRAPGVRSGVNRHGCCAGPMQFNTRDGPPSTWQRYGSDANHDGITDVRSACVDFATCGGGVGFVGRTVASGPVALPTDGLSGGGGLSRCRESPSWCAARWSCAIRRSRGRPTVPLQCGSGRRCRP